MAKKTELDKRPAKVTIKKKYLTLFRTSILLSLLILILGVLGTALLIFTAEPAPKQMDETVFLSYGYPILISIVATLITIFTINLLWFKRNILSPLSTVESGLVTISLGNYERKLRIKSNDEFEKIAESFNQISEKLSQIASLEEEKKQFQDNLIKFLSILNLASEGDLTKRAELTPDIFGSIGDSLNLFLERISEFIKSIDQIRGELEEKLEELNRQIDSIRNLAYNELETSTETEVSQSQSSEKAPNQEMISNILKETIDSLKQSTQIINENISNLHKIVSSSQFNEQKMRELYEKISEIESPINALKDSMSRINLHSLNISVEASKAGDEGKGILILSGEIRNISEKILDRLGGLLESISQWRDTVNPLIKTLEEEKSYIDSESRLLSEIVSINDKVERGINRAISTLSESQNLPYVLTKEVETNRNIEGKTENIKALLLKHAENLTVLYQSLSEKISEISSLISKFQIGQSDLLSEMEQLSTDEENPLEVEDIEKTTEVQEEEKTE